MYDRINQLKRFKRNETIGLHRKMSGLKGTELADFVRHWVHFDNLAESLQKQVSNARQMRTDFEEKILKLLQSSGMQNTILQISGANLQRTTKVKTTDISWGFLEEHLHMYFQTNGKPDDTQQIIDFLQNHRNGKTVEFLKKTLRAETGKK